MAAAIWVVIPSAGKGTRFGADIPKQFLRIQQKTILEHTLQCFLRRSDIKGIILLVSLADFAHANIVVDSRVTVIAGGLERSDSVMNALHYLQTIADPNDLVAVHDAARPCVRQSTLDRLFNVAHRSGGAILAIPAIDTIKWVDGGVVVNTLERERVYQAQTPQVFRYKDLLQAMQSAKENNDVITDESSAIEKLGLTSNIVIGEADNIKITKKADLALAEFYLSIIEREND